MSSSAASAATAVAPNMALNFISRSLLNQYLADFLAGYCRVFPDLESAQDMKDDIDNLIELEKELRERSKPSPEEKAARDRMTREERLAEEEEDRKERASLAAFAEIIISSFQPFETMLKSCDERLLEQSGCTFIHMLELNRKWWTDMPPKEKEAVWKFLNGAYLIVEFCVCTPRIVLLQLEQLIDKLFQKIIVRRERFDKPDFLGKTKAILAHLEDSESSRIANFFWEFVTSRFSPIVALTGEQYKEWVVPILRAIQSEDGRQNILNEFSPLVSSVTSRAGRTGISFDTKTGAVNFDAEMLGDTKEALEKKKQAKEKILESVIDSIGDILSKNEDLVNSLMDDPSQGAKSLLGKLMPMIMRIIGGRVFGSGETPLSEEEAKKLHDEQRARALKGATAVRIRTPQTSSSSSSALTAPQAPQASHSGATSSSSSRLAPPREETKAPLAQFK